MQLFSLAPVLCFPRFHLTQHPPGSFLDNPLHQGGGRTSPGSWNYRFPHWSMVFVWVPAARAPLTLQGQG